MRSIYLIGTCVFFLTRAMSHATTGTVIVVWQSCAGADFLMRPAVDFFHLSAAHRARVEHVAWIGILGIFAIDRTEHHSYASAISVESLEVDSCSTTRSSVH